MRADPFDTERLRRIALDAWRADPTRFRQDANLEEDFAHGFYRDRLVVELAQNAADAALTAGVPGRLLLRLSGPRSGDALPQPGEVVERAAAELIVANTGVPLDRDGVAALASLRASGKTGQSQLTGRFGVGFAAVRAVSDDVRVLTRTVAGIAGVHFSRSRAAELLVAELGPDGDVADHAAERGGDLPMLRLPFAIGPDDVEADDVHGGADVQEAEPVPAGYDTVVRLRLRAEALAPVRRALADIDDALLLALPGLSQIRVELSGEDPRTVADVADRWTIVRRDGRIPGDILAGRPVEERRRDGWSLTWAWPRAVAVDPEGRLLEGPRPEGRLPGVVLAPTPTDDRCTLPALLCASFGLDASRRRVAGGPLRDLLVANAADAYVDLVAEVAVEPSSRGGVSVFDAVPPGLPAGELDAVLREAAMAALGRADLLPAADGERVAPAAAVMIDGPPGADSGLVRALAAFLGGLVAVEPRHRSAARTLGVAQAGLAEIVERLPVGGGDLAAWQRLYGALTPYAVSDAEALAMLPVPLADGRWSRGARGTFILDGPGLGGPDADGSGAGDPYGADVGDPRRQDAAEPRSEVAALAAAVPGLRLVAPGGVHPVLASLGARRLTAAELLDQPALRQAVEALGLFDADADADTALGPAALPRPISLALDLLALSQGSGDGQGSGDTQGSGDELRFGGTGQVPDWLGGLPLPGADDRWWPARDLVLPGSPAADLLDGLVAVRADVAGHWPAEALAAAGVRIDLVVVTVADVVADPHLAAAGPDDSALPDDWDGYLGYLAELLGTDAYVGDVEVVADLDVVDPDDWAAVLRRIAHTPSLRRALLQPVRHAVAGAVGTAQALSYTAWWLRDELGAPFGCPVGESDTAAADDEAQTSPPFLPPAPAALEGLDAEVLTALGAVADLADLDETGWHRYVETWPTTGELGTSEAVLLWRGLHRAAQRRTTPHESRLHDPSLHGTTGSGWELDAPAIPALLGERVRMEPDPVVGPIMWAQVRPVLPAPEAAADDVADLLDLDVAEEVEPQVSGALRQPVPAAVGAVLPGAPSTWWECEELAVEGVEVTWWLWDGQCYAATTAGLARALAAAAGAWSRRSAVEILLAEPERLTETLLESAVE